MNSPNYSVGREPALLCRQSAELLRFLEKTHPLWLDSRLEDLSEVPRNLEILTQKLTAMLSDLQRRLRMNGFSTLAQWEESKNRPDSPSNLTTSGQIKEVALQVKQFSQTQNLLVQNLLILIRGVAMLNRVRQNAVYSQPNRQGRSAVGNVRYRG